MKSAYELAMERLRAQDPSAGSSRPLTSDQKQRLAALDTRYQAKIAEREIFLQKQLAQARQQGDGEAFAQLERQLRDERARLREELEAEKEKVRGEA